MGTTLVDCLLAPIAAGLAREAALREQAQAVVGLDGLVETEIHPLVAGALQGAGYAVEGEVRYPAARKHARRSVGRRCDLVLRSGPGLENQPYWLEMKLAAQFTPSGPARDYSGRLLGSAAEDVAKMAADPGIRDAGVLLLLHTAGREVARHDLLAWRIRCLERDLPVFAPAVQEIPIGDRLGNTLATLALFPVGRLG